MGVEKRTIEMGVIFFFNDTATTEIYTLSLHDALPILYDLGKTPDSNDMFTSLQT